MFLTHRRYGLGRSLKVSMSPTLSFSLPPSLPTPQSLPIHFFYHPIPPPLVQTAYTLVYTPTLFSPTVSLSLHLFPLNVPSYCPILVHTMFTLIHPCLHYVHPLPLTFPSSITLHIPSSPSLPPSHLFLFLPPSPLTAHYTHRQKQRTARRQH